MEQMTAPAQAPRAVHNAANQTPKHRFILKKKNNFPSMGNSTDRHNRSDGV